MLRSSGYAQNQAAGWHAGAGGNQYVFYIVYLVHRAAAHLAHPFGDAVHAVDVGLAQLPAMGIDRQPPAPCMVPGTDEVLGATPIAEAELFQLRHDKGREMVIDDGSLDRIRTQAGLAIDLPGHHAHLRQAGDVVTVEGRHALLTFGNTLGRSLE